MSILSGRLVKYSCCARKSRLFVQSAALTTHLVVFVGVDKVGFSSLAVWIGVGVGCFGRWDAKKVGAAFWKS